MRRFVIGYALIGLGACSGGSGGYYGRVTDGGAGDGAADLAGAGGNSDSGAQPGSPCGDVPTTGLCYSDMEVSRCEQVMGTSKYIVVSRLCKPYETCTVNNGVAACTAKQGGCEPGASQCVDGSTMQSCDAGAWVKRPCAQCKDSGFGATCGGNAQASTYGATVQYEARAANQNLSDWEQATFLATGQGLFVVSYTWDQNTQKLVALDSATTDQNGHFTIKVPAQPSPNDEVTLWAVRPSPGGLAKGIEFAVAEPDVPDGQWDVNNNIPAGMNAGYWGWTYRINALPQNGSTLTIHEADGSGALRVFDYLRYVYETTQDITGQAAGRLVVWIRYNTSWSCGSCFGQWPITLSGYDFDDQLFIPATAQDTEYWSDAVSAHELGHFVMASYGTSPNEGGAHYLGCPSPPGLAWSEGWATSFSSLARSSPVYYDKQMGSFFWFNIAQRVYDGGLPWQGPQANNGLLQQIDENEVAAMIWGLADNAMVEGQSLTSNKSFFDALESTRLNNSPFGRGYTTHTWDVSPGTCDHVNLADTGISAPMFADFLDAMVCAGEPAARVDAVTNPGQRYPYPSNAPICQ